MRSHPTTPPEDIVLEGLHIPINITLTNRVVNQVKGPIVGEPTPLAVPEALSNATAILTIPAGFF